MTAWIQKYSSVVRMEWIRALEYKANTFVGTFSIFSGVLIEYVLWKQIFTARGVAEINGFTFEALIVYIFFAMMVGQLKSSWVVSIDMIDSIRLGELNKYLIRPISFYTYHFSVFLGYNSLFFFTYMSLCLIFPYVLPGFAFPTIINLFGFWMFLIFSIYISFGMYFIMICGAFWFGEVRALVIAYNLANLVFSGQMIPIRMFPEWLIQILQFTPLPILVDLPVSVALGYLPSEFWMQKVFLAIFWCIIVTVIGQIVYRIGIKRYEGFGG